ncbi:unnamed protein product, partial [Echinostoma caproni]|uniref:Calponin-homology (CH) domain-containing protein n=1 Tax=Echinostoma caproni TaxID=27848 RepID=A0A183AWF3_9TREM
EDKTGGPKQRLLGWIKQKIPDASIKNFTTDWNSGVAIGALVDACAPGLCPDWPDWDTRQSLRNATEAMTTAEEWLCVPQLIRPEEMVNPSVDEKAMMTYISQFPNAKLREGAPLRPKRNPNKVRAYGPGVEPTGNTLGNPCKFVVETADAGRGQLEVIVLNPKGAREPCNVVANNDMTASFSCTYEPRMDGEHRVIIKFAGQEIPHSPFRVNIDGPAADPSKVIATGPGVDRHAKNCVGRPTYFNVNAQTAALAALTAAAEAAQKPIKNTAAAEEIGLTGRVSQITSNFTQTQVDGFTNGYDDSPQPENLMERDNQKPGGKAQLTQPNKHNGKLTTDEENRTGNLETNDLTPNPHSMQPAFGDGNANYSIHSGILHDPELLMTATMPVMGNFRDNLSSTQNEATCLPDILNKEKLAVRGFDDEISTSFVLPEPVLINSGNLGLLDHVPEYTTDSGSAKVRRESEESLPPAPQSLDDLSGGEITAIEDLPPAAVSTASANEIAFNPELVYATGRGVQARGIRAQDDVQFLVHTERAGEQAQVKATMVRSDGSSEPVRVEQTDKQLWTCSYVPQRPGKYTLRVLYGNGDIQNSPFNIVVGPHKKCGITAFGPGLVAGVVNHPNVFTVCCREESSKIGEVIGLFYCFFPAHQSIESSADEYTS